MSYRPKFWMLVSVAMFAAAAWFWHLGQQHRTVAQPVVPPTQSAPAQSAAQPATSQPAIVPAPVASATNAAVQADSDEQKRFPNRLRNTTLPIGQLARSETAILLQNALLETAGAPVLRVPERFRAVGEHGSYIVQSRGPISPAFRALLDKVGAEVVAYIPNNAYLVRMDDRQADRLPRLAEVQAVLPYEPYYKLDLGLLDQVLTGLMPQQSSLFNVLAFPSEAGPVRAALTAAGAEVLNSTMNPFGPVFMVSLPENHVGDLALITGVQRIERAHDRTIANDLVRLRVKVSFDSTLPSPAANHLGLDGTGVLVNVNDTGLDEHPDLLGRIRNMPLPPADTVGHGTHVAGIIGSSGVNSPVVAFDNIPGSVTNADFRGIAPMTEFFWQPISLTAGAFFSSDEQIQQGAARTNALISNNSWAYVASYGYDLAAASYDIAVRDSLPGDTGDQPVLYVFPSGNFGGGQVNGTGGLIDSVNSPGTAKNVITVGALEQLRLIDTNYEYCVNGVIFTNSYLEETDSSSQVAHYSGRGNVDPGFEGAFGRFKPDLVAPGSFVLSLNTTNRVINTNNTSTLTRSVVGQSIQPGQTNIYYLDFVVPGTALVYLTPNEQSPLPLPPLEIFVDTNNPPASPTFPIFPVGTNYAVVTVPAGRIYFAVENNNSQPVAFDATLIAILENCGNQAGINESLNTLADPAGFYRYNSGTSMATPVVSGMAALIRQYLASQGLTNPSPALIKAMLINGAKSALPGYSYNVNVFNPVLQGWGVPDITNSLPFGGTSLGTSPYMKVFEQSVTNALATGDSQTYTVSMGGSSTNALLRVTLVWTDPPGNPGASVKLVNNLDLIVTNLDSGDVYVGNFFENDIYSVGVPSSVYATNPPITDFVNNVENVYIGLPGGTNYSVTVAARRVNVQARDDFFSATGGVNDVVQDYALVISSDPFSLATLSVTPAAIVTNPVPVVTAVEASTNALPLINQRVGANPVLLAAGNTNGLPTQWVFYEVTNTVSGGSNVVFATFFPPNVSRSRFLDADLDLFVSTDPNLTNLSPAVIDSAATLRSTKRGGTELITLSNSVQGAVYYVGVKSEDQQAAEFGFFAAASINPFSQRDTNGNLIVSFIPVPAPIPDGEASAPMGAQLFGIAIDDGLPGQVQRITVTNIITHDDIGDLQVVLLGPPDDLGQTREVVLRANNYFPDELNPTSAVLYDDSEQNDPPPALPLVATHTSGPGSLEDYVGQSGFGLWQLTAIDNVPVFEGTFDFASLRIEPSGTNGGVQDIRLNAGGCYLDAVNVPVGATNFTVFVEIITPGQNVEVYIRDGLPPTRGVYSLDKYALFGPGPLVGASLSVTPFDSPPLNPGLYYVLFCNPDPNNPVDIRVTYIVDVAPTIGTPIVFTNASGAIPLIDDALTNSVITVTNAGRIAEIAVGVRLDHPRVSDLALHLRSPQGTRILLAENRGGSTGTNYGGPGPFLTNFIPVFASNFDTNTPGLYTVGSTLDGWTVATNPVTLVNNAALAHTPDQFIAMSTGVVTRTLPTGAGTNYTVVFRYRIPPSPLTNGSFETPAIPVGATTYAAPANMGGWIVESSEVERVNSWAPANGSVLVDLHGFSPLSQGVIRQDVQTIPGVDYQLQFAYAGNPDLAGVKTFDFEWNSVVIGSASFDSTGFTYTNLGWIYTNVIVQGLGATSVRFTSTTPASSFGPILDDVTLLPVGTVMVDIPGVVTTNLVGTNGWQTFAVSFTATGPTPITIAGIDGGMLIDSFSLSEGVLIPTITYTYFTDYTNYTTMPIKYGIAPFVDNGLPVATTNYFLPEEPMSPFRDQIAGGNWILEVWDSRLGQPLATLLEWRLEIIFAAAAPVVTPIVNHQCITNTVATNEIHYYAVLVPTAATMGTNILTSVSGGGLDLDFNQNFRPGSGQPGDFQLLANATAGQAVLDTNGVPPLIPGSVYYLAVANNNPTETNTYVLCVEFDVASITSSSFQSATATSGQTIYYQFQIPATAAMAQFDLVNLSGPAGLVVSRAPGHPVEGSAQYSSSMTGANDKQIVITKTSSPVALGEGIWNVGVVNKSGVGLTHSVRATTFDQYGNADGVNWVDATLDPGAGPSGGTPVTFNTIIGLDYQVEWSGTMTNWNALTNFTATNVLSTVIDPTSPSSLNQRFYRLLRVD